MSTQTLRRRWTAKLTTGFLVATAAFVVVPATASQAASGCSNKSSVVSNAQSGHVRGTGGWSCSSASGTFAAKVQVYHNMGFAVPDALVAENTWSLTRSTSVQTRYVQRCDNSNTVQYHSDAELPDDGSVLHSSDQTITACSGTGS